MIQIKSSCEIVNAFCIKQSKLFITGGQVRAARGFLRWSANELAQRAKLGRLTITRAESADGKPSTTEANLEAIRRALESAGIEFIPENGGGAGVRLRKAEH